MNDEEIKKLDQIEEKLDVIKTFLESIEDSFEELLEQENIEEIDNNPDPEDVEDGKVKKG